MTEHRIPHPAAMPWWRRVIEIGDRRLLWCDAGDGRALISLQVRQPNGRFEFDRIFYASFGTDPEADWADGERFIREGEHALCTQDWHRCADDGGPGEYDRYVAGKCGLDA